MENTKYLDVMMESLSRRSYFLLILFGFTSENGGLTIWTSWSSCPKECGNGRRSRTRICTNGGQNCIGDLIETKTCKLKNCPGTCLYCVLSVNYRSILNFRLPLIFASRGAKIRGANKCYCFLVCFLLFSIRFYYRFPIVFQGWGVTPEARPWIDPRHH